jgi:hypothetical protein
LVFSGRAGKGGEGYGQEENETQKDGSVKEESEGKENPDQEEDPHEEKRRNKIYWSGYQNTSDRTGHSH